MTSFSIQRLQFDGARGDNWGKASSDLTAWLFAYIIDHPRPRPGIAHAVGSVGLLGALPADTVQG